jgi:LysR family nitrogen assimilation transcriptional regulator
MELRHLRTFITVADEGTVSRASLVLHVAQPALSRQIRDLEEELGVQLFERIRGRLVLTTVGERLLAHSRIALGAVHSVRERAKALRAGDSGTLKIATPAQMIERVFATFLHHYAKRRPNVQIQLKEEAGEKMLALLERGDIDLAVGLKRLMSDKRFEIMQLAPVEFLAAYRSCFDLGKGSTVEVARLAPYPLLVLEPIYLFRHTFDAACRLVRFKPQILLESRTAHSLLSLAQARHGIAVVPSVAPTAHYKLDIRRITHGRKPLREELCVFWDSRRTLPSYATDFCESLAGYTRKLFRS